MFPQFSPLMSLSAYKTTKYKECKVRRKLPWVAEVTGLSAVESPFLQLSSRLFILRLEVQWSQFDVTCVFSVHMT